MAFSTLSFQKKDIDADVFSDALTAGLRPVNYRPEFRGDEAFLEDVVGNLTQIIEMMFVQFDTLHGARVRCMVVKIDVTEPEASRYVINDELQGALWSLANTLLEEVQDEVAWFNNNTVFAFPMSEGSVLRLEEALAEDMVKDVFYINELFVQFNELDSRWMAMVPVGSHLVCKPKLRRYSHNEELLSGE